MKKKSFLHRFKKYNTIKLVTLILLLIIPLIGILVYNKSLFEAMTINIYASGEDYKISKEGDNNSNEDSNSDSNSNSNRSYL